MRFSTLSQAFIFLLVSLLGSATQAGGVNIDAVRFSHQPTALRLVFESDAGLKHHLLQLSGPDRVVLDLVAANLSPRARQQLEAVEQATALVSDLRVASRGSGPCHSVQHGPGLCQHLCLRVLWASFLSAWGISQLRANHAQPSNRSRIDGRFGHRGHICYTNRLDRNGRTGTLYTDLLPLGS